MLTKIQFSYIQPLGKIPRGFFIEKIFKYVLTKYVFYGIIVLSKQGRDKMTAQELEKIILKDGWKFESARGSHRQYKHGTKKGKVTIPWHKGDIPKGTLNSVLKQAGLK